MNHPCQVWRDYMFPFIQFPLYKGNTKYRCTPIELLRQKEERKCTREKEMGMGTRSDKSEISIEHLVFHDHKLLWLNSASFLKRFPSSILWAILGKYLHKISKPYVCWQAMKSMFLVRKFHFTLEISDPTDTPASHESWRNRWKWEPDFNWDLILP